jgi:hypothetical protein
MPVNRRADGFPAAGPGWLPGCLVRRFRDRFWDPRAEMTEMSINGVPLRKTHPFEMPNSALSHICRLAFLTGSAIFSSDGITLRIAGASDQVAILLARQPATHTALDNPHVIARLLNALRAAGAAEYAKALLARDPAAHVAIDDPDAVARLLLAFRAAGASDQVAILVGRQPASHSALDNSYAVAQLLRALRAVGGDDQAQAPAARAATRAPIDYPWAVAQLLHAMRKVGATGQAEILLARDPAAHVAIDHPGAVDQLIHAFHAAGTINQARVLQARVSTEGSTWLLPPADTGCVRPSRSSSHGRKRRRRDRR